MSKIEELQEKSIEEILRYFKSASAAKEGGWIKDSAKIAVSALATVARIKGTERAKDATQLMVLKHITDDPKLFEKYVKVSMPHLSPTLQIEHKKKN